MPNGVEELTAAMAAGDARAVERFYRRYFDLMYCHAHKVTGRDESFCLDVVQNAVLRVMRTVRKANSEAQLASWLRLVVQTAAYDLLKSESRRRKRESFVSVAADAANATDDEPVEDRLIWLRNEISSLDPQIVRMIELRYQNRWKLARIAEAMGLSIGTVDGRLRRALRGLRLRATEAER